ncbi:2-hydroxycarboxylate transporter family protein [Fructobacillus parabroussonetiae]|uniref:2-hydroxycarboxylate transporter family protein n=1 Tax=Fructobacillus parabroussonetiae TaxID=2713174 RepID=A0ABS5QWG1_9LACO|nr:2-hydroxycarboxylate transporter family protein [Fructobacillus parabroussonetiae]MBS9337551.1 2-hydroxycarboxylate transporter family protein [Fructobacillus parabroussonetiae]
MTRQFSKQIGVWLKKGAALSIDGFGLLAFILLFCLMIAMAALNWLPKNMVGVLFTLVSLGGALYYLGSHLPIVRSYLGGGSVFATVGAALLASLGWVRQPMLSSIKTFLTTSNFLAFYIVSLIVSAIFKMDRQLVLKATVRFLPVAFLTMFLTVLIVGVVGQLIGLGFYHTSLFVTFPMMAGGVGAGIVPLSSIYGGALGQPSGVVLSQLFPPLVLSNLLAIIAAGLLVKNSQHSAWNGQGRLLRNRSGEETSTKSGKQVVAEELLIGMMIAFALYLLGICLHRLLPAVNTFAFLILLTVVVKASGLLPGKYEEAAVSFGQVIVKTMTHGILAGVGLTLLDLSALVSTLSWQLVLCVLVSICSMMGLGAVLGQRFGLYPIESAVTAGLINQSMGGTGNVAVLSAADRMNLIAFAQMGNRIGGAIVLVVAGIMVSISG